MSYFLLPPGIQDGRTFSASSDGSCTGRVFTSAIVIVILMFTISFAINHIQAGVIASMKQQAVRLKRWGGWVLGGVGLWLILLSIFASSFAILFPV